jgi:hypothetical protein
VELRPAEHDEAFVEIVHESASQPCRTVIGGKDVLSLGRAETRR